MQCTVGRTQGEGITGRSFQFVFLILRMLNQNGNMDVSEGGEFVLKFVAKILF
jgi:hypothetical protein